MLLVPGRRPLQVIAKGPSGMGSLPDRGPLRDDTDIAQVLGRSYECGLGVVFALYLGAIL